MSAEFQYDLEVFYEDTDAEGIVYYANYLKFAERARTRWLRDAGVSQQALLRQGLGFVVAAATVRFLRSACLDDRLRVTCVPLRIGPVKLSLYQEVRRGASVIARMEFRMAMVDRTHAPVPFPAALRDFFASQIPADPAAYGVKR